MADPEKPASVTISAQVFTKFCPPNGFFKFNEIRWKHLNNRWFLSKFTTLFLKNKLKLKGDYFSKFPCLHLAEGSNTLGLLNTHLNFILSIRDFSKLYLTEPKF